MKSQTNKMALNIGKIGEDVATSFIEEKGLRILSRNYKNKWGEIDIVAEKSDIPYFFEVKSVLCEKETDVLLRRPEERVDSQKRDRLKKIVRTFLLDKYHTEERNFEFRVITVSLVPENKKAFVKVISEVL